MDEEEAMITRSRLRRLGALYWVKSNRGLLTVYLGTDDFSADEQAGIAV